MTTSGTTLYSLSTLEIIEAAFANLGIAQEGEALTPRMYTDGLRGLNLLINTFNAHPRLWIYTEGALALVVGQAAYVVSPPALRVTDVRRRTSGIETPMNMISRQEYYDQPNKTENPSTPVSFYFDPQVSQGTLYLWPSPDSQAVTQFTVTYTYIRRMDVMTSTNDTLDMPQEWLEPVIWNLAKRLLPQYPVNDGSLAQIILGQAGESYANLMAWDNEPASLFMQPDQRALSGYWRA